MIYSDHEEIIDFIEEPRLPTHVVDDDIDDMEFVGGQIDRDYDPRDDESNEEDESELLDYLSFSDDLSSIE